MDIKAIIPFISSLLIRFLAILPMAIQNFHLSNGEMKVLFSFVDFLSLGRIGFIRSVSIID